MPKFVINIELKESDGVWKEDYIKHIRTAVGHWSGSNTPDYPFFPSNIKKVTVAPLGSVLRSAKGSKV